jgi:glycosyltransferase involved in cell wall biosynthesis
VLIMPSYFESLSMVALEAWALGKAVLANAKCEVLKGQCVRSNAGLYYERYAEFAETLHAIEHNRWLSGSLGRNGRQYFQNNYDWRVIERKYLDMLAQLSNTPAHHGMEPLPGKRERRLDNLAPAEDVLGRLPNASGQDRMRA